MGGKDESLNFVLCGCSSEPIGCIGHGWED